MKKYMGFFYLVFGGAVAQSVERATPGEEVLGSWLGLCQYNATVWYRNHGLPALSYVWQYLKLSDASLGTHQQR